MLKKVLTSRFGFFTIAAILIWIKSYVIYLTEFNLDIQNNMQQFLLLINPLSSILIILGITLFARGSRYGLWIISLQAFMGMLLYANVVFYRFNNDYITLPVLTQTDNFSSLGGSIISLMEWVDVLHAVDIILLIGLFIFMHKQWPQKRMSFYKPAAVMIIGIIVFMGNLHLAESDRPELLERTFDRNYIVKYLGVYNFTVYDMLQSVQASTQRVLADSSDITEIENYARYKYAEPNEKLFGIGAEKNIIKIHLESFQSFLIDFELHGQEVTPFINSLVHDKEYTFFENFFHQTEQGKTADAELILDTSLYGLPQGAAFVTRGTNTYQALPAILNQQQNYTSAVFHGDGKSFWNRDEIYKQFAIDRFFHESFYDMSPGQTINYGLKDKPFFEESIPYLQALPEPFYAHMMTLTHHHPFIIEPEEATIEPAETGSRTVNRYFQTARYLDEALEQFFKDLKEAGLYDDSIIFLYGDHYGISENHNRAMSELLGGEMSPFKSAHLQRVPFFIKIPEVDGMGIVDKYTGQIDVMPTLLHILGIDAIDYIQFGSDMFSDNHPEVVAFRKGDFITPNFSKIGDQYYEHSSGELVDPTEEMIEINESVQHELELSDKVLYGDLLRFYQPTTDWEPVDPSDYFYSDD